MGSVNDTNHLGPHSVVKRDAYVAALRKGEDLAPEIVIGKAAEPDPEIPISVKGDTVTFVGTSSKLDRDQDVIRAAGVETANWEKRPVILASHDATKSIGVGTGVERRGARTVITMDFYPREIQPLAGPLKDMLAFNLERKGLSDVGAVFSIGFRSIEAKFNSERGGVDFGQIETLEFSLVAMATNPAASLISAKEAQAAGINLDPLLDWATEIYDKAGFALAPTAFLVPLLKTIDPSNGLVAVELASAHAAGLKYRESRKQLLETTAGTVTKTEPEEIAGEILETSSGGDPVALAYQLANLQIGAEATRNIMRTAGMGELAEGIKDSAAAPAALAKPEAKSEPEEPSEDALSVALKEVDLAERFTEKMAARTGHALITASGAPNA